ncbi:MAG: hypothetical protein IKR31_06570 [Prevotella sp.]|jgi:hypothetical protein|nr:hypothetical protein [Prevotella sp.]
MKKYLKPQLEIVDMEVEDMIALSVFTDEFAGMDEECLDRLVLTDFE